MYLIISVFDQALQPYCGLKVLWGQCWTSVQDRQGSMSFVKLTIPL